MSLFLSFFHRVSDVFSGAPAKPAVYGDAPIIDTTTVYAPVVPRLLAAPVPKTSLAGQSIDGKVENFLRSSIKLAALSYCKGEEVLVKSCFGCKDSALTGLHDIMHFDTGTM